MRIYRLYFLNRENDVQRTGQLVCADDETAIRAAEADSDETFARKELWQSANLVKAWTSTPD